MTCCSENLRCSPAQVPLLLSLNSSHTIHHITNKDTKNGYWVISATKFYHLPAKG